MPIDDPILHWDFEEGTGTTATDQSGNGRNGTLIGTPTWIAGQVGTGALRLNGTSQRVSFTAVNMGTAYTVALWVYVREAGDGILVSGTNTNYAFYYDATDLYHSVNAAFDSAPHGGLTDGWHHLAVTRNGTNLIFYKDGTQLAVMSANTDALSISSLGAYAAGTFWSQVDVDEFRIYNRQLTASEVEELYEYPGGAGTDYTATLNASTATGATRAPTVSTGANVSLTPSACTATASTRTPTVALSVTLTPIAAAATAGMPVLIPVATYTADAATAAAGTNAPAVSTGANVTRTPSAVTATGGTLAPTVALSLTLTVSAAAATGGTLAPSAQTSGTVTLNPSAQTAAAGTPAPSVSLGFGVTLPAITATAATRPPAIDTAGHISLSPAAAASAAATRTVVLQLGSLFALTAVSATATTRAPAHAGPQIVYIGRVEPGVLLIGRVEPQ